MGNPFVRRLIAVIFLVGAFLGTASPANVVVNEFGMPALPVVAPKDAWSGLSELAHLLNNEIHQMRQYIIPVQVFQQLANQNQIWQYQAINFPILDNSELWANALEHNADALLRQKMIAPIGRRLTPPVYQAYRNFSISLTNALYMVSNFQYATWRNYMAVRAMTPAAYQVQAIVAQRLQRIEYLKWMLIDLDRRVVMFNQADIYYYGNLPMMGTRTPYVLGNYIDSSSQQTYYQPPPQQGQFAPGGGQYPNQQAGYGAGSNLDPQGQLGSFGPALPDARQQPYPFIPQGQPNGNATPYFDPKARPDGYQPPAPYANGREPQPININIGGPVQNTNTNVNTGTNGTAGGGAPNLGASAVPQQTPINTTQGNGLQPVGNVQGPNLQMPVADPAQTSGVVANDNDPVGTPQKYKF